MADVNEVQSKASKIFKEGRTMTMKLYFTQPDAAYITERMDDTEQRLKNLQTKAQKQLSRLVELSDLLYTVKALINFPSRALSF